MATLFNSAGLVSRLDKKKAVKLATELTSHLEKKGLQIFLEPQLAEKTKRTEMATPINQMKTDLIITIGGDGTILRTCLSLPKPEPPILAINMGVRGFLAEIPPKNAYTAVDKCLEGKFILERCTKLAAFIQNDGKLPDALNEVFIATDAPVKLLYANIWKNGVLVGQCRADGVMVASQAGSTGYSLSAGGPVIDPETDAFVFTPVCSLSTFHPIVFSANSTITIEVLRPRKLMIVVDGHHRKLLEAKNPRVSITKSEYVTSFIRFNGDFYRRLKGRLLFPRV